MPSGVSDERYGNIGEIMSQTAGLVRELLGEAALESGDALVIGCSSSEIARHRIGSYSSAEIGEAVCRAVLSVLDGTGIYLAAQCCEHLNRALIVEKQYAHDNRIPTVCAVPKLKAGGAFATAAYRLFKEPVTIESIQAGAGIDIGDTIIGMHLRPVAVPVRGSISEIGSAHVVMARTRPRYIGGERTAYC